jgi:hypothetical protein
MTDVYIQDISVCALNRLSWPREASAEDSHSTVCSIHVAWSHSNRWTGKATGRKYIEIIYCVMMYYYTVPHDRLLTKLSETGVEWRVVNWIKNFLSGRTQRVRIDGHLSDEVRVHSGVPEGSVLGPLLLLAYVNYIWRNIESH